MKKNEPLQAFHRSILNIFLLGFGIGSAILISLVVSLVGYFFSVEHLTALCLILVVGLCALFYLVLVYNRDRLDKLVLDTKQALGQAAHDQKTKAELFSSLAFGVCYLPPRLCRYHMLNKVLGYIMWYPFHRLAEALFLAAIEQQIQLIKLTPTNLFHHATLANYYVMLTNHYQRPLSQQKKIYLTNTLLNRLSSQAELCSKRSIEELSILRSFAPDELWVRDQLAIAYRELDMLEEELQEYEVITELSPDDYNALLQLGTLYFKRGESAKGLEVYERLNSVQPLLAETLINHYGAYHYEDTFGIFERPSYTYTQKLSNTPYFVSNQRAGV